MSKVEAHPGAAPANNRLWQRTPTIALGLILLLVGFTLAPPVSGNPGLTWAFRAAIGFLAVWLAILSAGTKVWGQRFRVELIPPLKSHYIQGTVQLCIYAYWGYYWRNVYAEAPLILAQLFFLCAFDALLSWSRGKSWRLGFGPLPIILSTNVFIWFKDDYYIFQFALVATGALGKEFIRWHRNGKYTHIFNPSAFALALFSVILIATEQSHKTWGLQIATTIGNPPLIYVEIFLVGLVVQYFFSVTLMTLSAVVTLYLLNFGYTVATGTFHFIDANIPVAVFLGLHLLMTDPSTSPKTNVGKMIFGTLYGAMSFALYGILEHFGLPDFYDKLLPVPILNLGVQGIDRLANSGVFGRFNRWESQFKPKTLNLAHMGAWTALFVGMFTTGYLAGPPAGRSIAFWHKAYDEGKPNAGRKLWKLVKFYADKGDAEACNQMGVLYMEGKLGENNRMAAATYFAKACELGNADGCANLATQFFLMKEGRSKEDVERAIQQLEQSCGAGGDGRGCYLIGFAQELGRGLRPNKPRAAAFYVQGCLHGNVDCAIGLARIRLMGAPIDLTAAVPILERAASSGDGQSAWYLAYLTDGGAGVARDPAKARTLMEKACGTGFEPACKALEQSEFPAFSPAVSLPSWAGGLLPEDAPPRIEVTQ
ncbi:MAG: hypothetical protein K8S98_18420 [Planctomycetes bacterium]|nr:hypothetical protein [Planctomycetota bacterium]